MLKKKAHPLTIEPLNTNFSDLSFLKDYIHNNRIVMLGEQHGDGSVLLAKIRLIKYLHKELGFNTIFFESSFYDCYKANIDAKNKVLSTETFFKSAILPHWSSLMEMQYLYDYIDSCNKTNNKITIYGFDCQLSGAYSKFLVTDFIHFAEKNKVEIPDSAKLKETYEILSTNPFLKNVSDSVKWMNLYTIFNQRITEILKNIKPNKENITEFKLYENSLLYLNYFTQNLYSKNNSTHLSYNSFRDSLMANNFIYLLNSLPTHTKIIVWAATAHIVTQSPLNTFKPMGQYLDEKLIKSYKIGFTHSLGNKLIIFDNIVRPIRRPLKYSPEWYLEQINQEPLFIDSKNFKQSAVNDLVIGNMLKNDKKGLFSKLDGIIYIKELKEAHPK